MSHAAIRGKLLRLNLSQLSSSVEDIDPNAFSTFIAGKGLGLFYFYKEIPRRAKPLTPQNKVILCTGPVHNVAACLSKCCVLTKSPQTGSLVASYIQGSLGEQIRAAGYELVIIEGMASKPIHLQVTDDRVVFADAASLWGKGSIESLAIIAKNSDQQYASVVIGPAGEAMIPLASTVEESLSGSTRGGIGAVLGSKNVKAISIVGSQQTNLTGSQAVLELEDNKKPDSSAQDQSLLELIEFGTGGFILRAIQRGELVALNFRVGDWEYAEAVSAQAIRSRYPIVSSSVQPEGQRCGRRKHIQTEADFGADITELTLDDLVFLGSNIGVSDIEDIVRVYSRCLDLGLDPISVGGVIAWFLEVAEKELVPYSYRDEKVSFGDVPGILLLVEKMVNKQGIGSVLCEGVPRSAARFGQNTEDFAVHIKDLEPPGIDPRGELGLGILYVLSPSHAHGTQSWNANAQKPSRSALGIMDKKIEELLTRCLMDLILLDNPSIIFEPSVNGSAETLATLLRSAIDLECSAESLIEAALSAWHLERMYHENQFSSLTPRMRDKLPRRLMKEALPSGASKGCRAFVDEYDYGECLDYVYVQLKCELDGSISPLLRVMIENSMVQ